MPLAHNTSVNITSWNTMINEISPADVKQLLTSGATPFILDVRQPEEHSEGHIPGCTLIPVGELPDRIGEVMQHKADDVIVYCRSGKRSAQACMLLELNGFENVKNLTGGMLAW